MVGQLSPSNTNRLWNYKKYEKERESEFEWYRAGV